MNTSASFRALAPLSLLILLSACWVSDTPLMPAKEMDSVKLGKAYWSVETDATMKPDRYVLTPKGKTLVAKIDTPGRTTTETNTLSFDKLQGSLYLTQIVSSAGKVRAYRIFDLGKPGEVRAFDPTCGFDEKANSKIQVSGSDCKFADYPTLKASAMARAAGIAKQSMTDGALAKVYKEDTAK